jgi:hypothetical protein
MDAGVGGHDDAPVSFEFLSRHETGEALCLAGLVT